MSLTAFFLILASTIFHASWNMVAKKQHFSIPFYMMLESTCLLCWGHALIWTPIHFTDLPTEFWLTVALGSGIFETLYGLGLQLAYSNMEMSVAYPIMRSLPLIFTAILTTAFGWGEPLTTSVFFGVIIVFFGCMMIPLAHFSDFSRKTYVNRNIIFILLVAASITGYTLCDKHAIGILAGLYPNVSSVTRSLTYYGYRMIGLIFTLAILTLSIPANRRHFRDLMGQYRWTGPMLAGVMASTTFVFVLVAMNYVTNVSYVQAFRQIGLVVGLVEGIVFLKEKAAWPKIIGVALIFIGLALMVLKFHS